MNVSGARFVQAPRRVNPGPLIAGGNADLFCGQRNDTGEYAVIKYLREYNSQHVK
jgi:hypothetical protein